MSFLSPLLLLAGLAAAVPLLLHLLQRSEGRVVQFPALRYLQRMAREHARSIRTRQLLLMLLRVGAILILTLAAARPILTMFGKGHPPTALVLVVDNSMSSGAVQGEVRVLDLLREAAAAALDQARPGDRIWVMRAAEPWLPSRPMSPTEARLTLGEIGVFAGGAAMDSVLTSALEIALGAGLEAAEVHLYYDGQFHATRRIQEVSVPDDVSLHVFRPEGPAPVNHWLLPPLVGGGLPPLPGERTEVTVELQGSEPNLGAEPSSAGSGEGVAPVAQDVRLTAAGRLRARTSLASGESGIMNLGPFMAGWIEGFVETEPDLLRADDRTFFAFQVREPVRVRVTGDPGLFVSQALEVLSEAGRIRLTTSEPSEVTLVGGGGTLSDRPRSTVILPPQDPSLLAATNRALERTGIAWRMTVASGQGVSSVTQEAGPDLASVEVRRAYALAPADGAGVDQVLARTGAGGAWIVSAAGDGSRVLLIGSPLDPAWTSLPLSAQMLPTLDWILTRWAPREEGTGGQHIAGGTLALPEGTDAVVDPSGGVHPVQPGGTARILMGPGIYRPMRGDSVLGLVAVNPPPEESDLRRVDAARGTPLADGLTTTTGDLTEWRSGIFRVRSGPLVSGVLVLIALLVLLLEGLVAAVGGRSASRSSDGAGNPSSA